MRSHIGFRSSFHDPNHVCVPHAAGTQNRKFTTFCPRSDDYCSVNSDPLIASNRQNSPNFAAPIGTPAKHAKTPRGFSTIVGKTPHLPRSFVPLAIPFRPFPKPPGNLAPNTIPAKSVRPLQQQIPRFGKIAGHTEAAFDSSLLRPASGGPEMPISSAIAISRRQDT
jgi:hypothetical protein